MATDRRTDCSKQDSPAGFATSRYIHLNVGGVPYMTSLETLTRYQDSMLAHMFTQENIPLARDEQGRFMIDRDGALFRYILNFLRDGKLVLPENFNETEQLTIEARFYQLDDLVGRLGCHLNVGGVHYTTARKILTSCEGSLLQDWFSQTHVPLDKDQDGRYLIERDGVIFQYVLNFLESDELHLPRRFREFKEIEEEAKYFRIPSMINALKIRLVVGNVAYSTTRAVLTSYPGSVLEDWFSQTPIPLEVDRLGRFTIPGDAKVFEFVLDMLKTRRTNAAFQSIPLSLGRDNAKRLLGELERYELTQFATDLRIWFGLY